MALVSISTQLTTGGITAVSLDDVRLPRVTGHEGEPILIGDRTRTVGGQLRTDAVRYIHRWRLESKFITYAEYLALRDLLERKNGAPVRLWLNEWPDSERLQTAISAAKTVIPLENTGPAIWPRFVMQAASALTSFSLEWRGLNLLKNADAETQGATATVPADWTAAGTPTWEPAYVKAGRRALRVTPTSTWSQVVDVAAGQWYYVSSWIASPGGDVPHNNLLKVEWLDSGGLVIGTPVSLSVNLVRSFMRHSHKTQAPAGAVQARLTLTTDQAGGAIYDDLQFEPCDQSAATPSPWQLGKVFTFALSGGLAAGNVLEVDPAQRLAEINRATATLASTSQWWPLPTGKQQVSVNTAGATISGTFTVALDWSIAVAVTSFREQNTPFMHPSGVWEADGRSLTLELEEV